MTDPCDCAENTDPRKLVRDGTHQAQRTSGAPDPARVPVDERRPEHAMVFASAYAAYLRYYDLDDVEQDTWQDFFAADVSAQLAVAAVEDVTVYRTTLKALLRSLEDPELPASAPAMIAALGAVFDCLGTLARRLDTLQQGLPAAQPLRATLGNLIRSQLSPMLQRLIGYYLAGDALGVVDRAAPPAGDVLILGQPLESFDALITGPGLSSEWPDGVGVVGWAAYVAVDPEPYKGAYGPSAAAVDQVNHLATHNLFTAICDTFLAVYARVVDEARAAVEATFEWDGHEPHYALFLAFLKLLEYARDEANTLTARHLEFYYRDVLRLAERPAEPGQAHVLVELAKHIDAHLLSGGTLLKAGKDDTGADAHFAVDRDLVANEAVVADLKKLYRHPDSEPLPLDHDRLFAAPAASRRRVVGALRRQGLRGRRAEVDRHASRRGRLRDRVPPPLDGRGHAAHRRRPAARQAPPPQGQGGRRPALPAHHDRGVDREAGRRARRERRRTAAWRSSSTATTRRSRRTTRPSTGTGSRPPCRCCW